MPLPELAETSSDPTAMTLEFASVTVPDSLQWSTVWQQADGLAWAQTARDRDAFYVRIAGYVDVRITAASISVAASTTARESTIRHLLVDQVLPLMLAAEGRLVLHASAVQRADAGVVALAGAAGTGKSTLAAAFLRAGWNVASDDGVLVEQQGDNATAIPAYSGLRLWPDAVDATGLSESAVSEVAEYSAKLRVISPDASSAAPLKAVYVIEPGNDARIVPLGHRDAAMALVKHAYCAEPGNAGALTAHLDACAALAARVPVSRAVVPRDLAQLARAVGVLGGHATFGHR